MSKVGHYREVVKKDPGRLGPRARRARGKLARAIGMKADQAEIDRLRAEFLTARAEEWVEAAQAQLAAVRNVGG